MKRRTIIIVVVLLLIPLGIFADGGDSCFLFSTSSGDFKKTIGSVEVTKEIEIGGGKINVASYDDVMLNCRASCDFSLDGDEKYISVKRLSSYWNQKNTANEISFALRYFFGGKDYVYLNEEELNLLREIDFLPVGSFGYLDAVLFVVTAKEAFLPVTQNQINEMSTGNQMDGHMYEWGVDALYDYLCSFYSDFFNWNIGASDIEAAEKSLRSQEIAVPEISDSLSQAKREKILSFSFACLQDERHREVVRILSCYLTGLGVRTDLQRDIIASYIRDVSEYKMRNSNWREEKEKLLEEVVISSNNKMFCVQLGVCLDGAYTSYEESSFIPKLKIGFGVNGKFLKIYLTGYAGLPVINNKFSDLTWKGEANINVIPVDWLDINIDATYASDGAINAQLIPMFNIGDWFSIGVGGTVGIKPEFDWALCGELYFFDTVGARIDYDVIDNTFALSGIIKF